MAPAAQRGGGAIALLAQGDPPHKGQDRRHISPGPAGKSLSRQARRQPILEPSRNPSQADSTPLSTATWRIVTDHLLSATSAIGVPVGLSTYSLPTMRWSAAGFADLA